MKITELFTPCLNSWQGTLDLDFRVDAGQTKLTQVQAQAPLKVQRPHYPEGEAVCYVTVMHTAGGLVSGDQLTQTLRLQPHCRTLMTTPAATKVYQSTGAASSQSTQIQVGSEAHLEWMPQETILFEKAHYQHHLHIDLEPGATALVWDLTRLGRSARGERFLEGYWRSTTEIWQGQRPLWIDRQVLPGGPVIRSRPSGLKNYPVVGTLAFVGDPVSDQVLATLRDQILKTQIQPELVGITRNLCGVVCRYRGPSIQDARRYFLAIWQHLRLSRYGTIPSIPRVWGSI